ncbi:MAG: 2-oxoacid:acceptor oxidoreductase family protein [Planctomycetota bacterium]
MADYSIPWQFECNELLPGIVGCNFTGSRTIKIGGEAGQGLQSVEYILAKTFCSAGYHIFTIQDYESRVRGGHSSLFLAT